MRSEREAFFELQRYAVVGHTDLRPFPNPIYRALRERGKSVYPVDLGGARYVEGDEAFAGLAELPEAVEAAILDVPRDRVPPVVEDAASMHLGKLWLQPGCESVEALGLCEARGVIVHTGARAELYLGSGFSAGRLLAKLLGRY